MAKSNWDLAKLNGIWGLAIPWRHSIGFGRTKSSLLSSAMITDTIGLISTIPNQGVDRPMTQEVQIFASLATLRTPREIVDDSEFLQK